MTRHRSVFFLLVVTLAAGFGHAEPKKRSTRSRAVEPKPFDAALVNDAAAAVSDTSAGILRAQILLDRATFSPGEIDGRSGANFTRAVSGFQESRGLAVSGKLDEPTWQALNADTVPAIVPYRITDADVAGPFIEIPKDLIEQSKLKSLGYQSAEEALGEQFHVSPGLLRRMNPASKFAAAEEIQVPNVVTAGGTPIKAAKVIVSKAGYVRALDGAGKILAQYPASSGSEHDPLPLGTWKITGVSKKPVFNYNPELFWDADPAHTKARIPAGPNNPVGSVWIDLTKEHYGIHGTPEPANVGHTQSHGCIRLTNWDAVELAGMVGPGIEAVLTQ
jgi:lipoprotein-anchoring transpeptidase ErfK/SrfK